jgi:hypothetical protein
MPSRATHAAALYGFTPASIVFNAPATPISSSLTIVGGRRDRIRQESLTTAEADNTTRRPPDSTALSRIATRSVPAR